MGSVGALTPRVWSAGAATRKVGARPTATYTPAQKVFVLAV